MINTGNKFSGGSKTFGTKKIPAIQTGTKIFNAIPESEEEYSLNLTPILFNENTTFAFSVSFSHQSHELFLSESPVITGFSEEDDSVNVRLKIKNDGKGAFEVKLYYTVFGGD